MSSFGSCTLCKENGVALATPSGLCMECYRSEARTPAALEPISVGEKPTVSAQFSPFLNTKTYDPDDASTRSFAIPSQTPITPADRIARLQAAHGFRDFKKLNVRTGMGEIYWAFDPGAGRPVAIKFIQWDQRSELNLRRFAIEGHALGRIEHANVARLYAVVTGDDPYFAMEFAAGGSLKDNLKEGGPMAGKEAARLIAGAARGVAASNREGVIHRDLKPANILLSDRTPEAIAKVADYGIAKDLDALDPMTRGHAIIGTPGFMSPEQAKWRSSLCDCRTDVWGLAATLYACVTGQPPYDPAISPVEVRFSTLVAPKQLAPELHPDLNAIILKGLERHPDDRYQTADEFADELDRFMRDQPVDPRPRPWPIRLWRRVREVPKGPAIAIAIAALSLALLFAAVLFRGEPEVALPRPDQSNDQWMDERMEELRASKTTAFLGQKGLPIWHRMARGQYSLAAPANNGGACTVSAVGEGWCQFTPDLPIDDYTLELQLRDIESTAPSYHIGFAIGLQSRTGADGATHSSAVRVEYSDFDFAWSRNLPTEDRTINATVDTFAEQDGRIRTPSRLAVGTGFAFRPTRRGVDLGEWRKFLVKASPGGLTVRTVDPTTGVDAIILDLSRVQIDQKLEAASRDQNATNPDGAAIAPPKWDSTKPFAVVANRATVGVRNLRVIPTRK